MPGRQPGVDVFVEILDSCLGRVKGSQTSHRFPDGGGVRGGVNNHTIEVRVAVEVDEGNLHVMINRFTNKDAFIAT